MNEWMTPNRLSRQSGAPVPARWLTIEVSLWGLLLLLALGLRLLRLDAAPLNTTEAHDALFAWRFAQGHGVPSTGGYSPVLLSGQWLIFLCFGANELAARLLPALAGAALALAPALLRGQLGRIGALAAGALLALSPTAVTLSRTASGDVFVALGALAFAGALWRFLNHRGLDDLTRTQNVSLLSELHESANQPALTHTSSSIFLAAFGLALMLISSPLAYSALLSFGLALLLTPLVSSDAQDRFREGWRAIRAAPNVAPYMAGVILGGSILLSTAFAWHPRGLGAAADLLPQWVSGFVRWSDSLSVTYPVRITLLYEPLILATGIVGAVRSILRRNQPSSLFFALWVVAALFWALLRPGRVPGDVLLALVPLACLGGVGLNALLEDLRRRGQWLGEGLYLAVSVVLWAYLVINLATYTSRPGEYSDIRLLLINLSLPTYLSLAMVALLLLWVFALGLGFVFGAGPALRGVGLSTFLMLVLYTAATSWGISQNHAANPRELLLLEPTAPEVRLLTASLTNLSYERRGDAHAIDMTIMIDDPALTWAVRDFREARYTAVDRRPISASAVIAPIEAAPPLGVEYIGQSFPLRRRWAAENLGCRWFLAPIENGQARRLDCSSLVEWILFRRSPDIPVEERVVLWLSQNAVDTNSLVPAHGEPTESRAWQ